MNLHCLALTSLTLLEKSETAFLCLTDPFVQRSVMLCFVLFFLCLTSLLYDRQQYLKFGVTVCVRRAQSFAERLRLGIAVIHGEAQDAESDQVDGRHSPPTVKTTGAIHPSMEIPCNVNSSPL